MHSPYTTHELDALMAAQTSVALAVTAVAWARPLRPRVAQIVFVLAVWVATLSPVTGELARNLGVKTSPDHAKHLIELAAISAGVAAVLSRRAVLMITGFLGAAALWLAPRYATDSDWDLAGADLAFLGLLVGIHYGGLQVAPVRPRRETLAQVGRQKGFLQDDLLLFGVATSLAALVATYVLLRHTNSGDEWADTYQAALFIKGRAYEPIPTCAEAFRSFWVYQYRGRSFAQYTPGWPLFMAPFIPLQAAWLAGPCSLGLLAVGVAHLSRRGAAGVSTGTDPRPQADVRAAGWLGGLAVTLGSTMLINGGSRYPHVFVAAMFAWSVEVLCRVTDPGLGTRAQWLLGLLLGTTAALDVGARPADGLTLGVGLSAYFVYALVRRRVGLRAVVGALLAGAAWSGLMLVIMRLQVGVWFKTGYSLTESFYPWNKFDFSVPKPDEVRASLPLAAGSYCWWPASPALGFAGLAALRGRARRLSFVMACSFVPFLVFYTLFEVGRHWDMGYGPRYELPCVVPMAIGTGVIAGDLWALGSRHVGAQRALARGGPIAVVLVAALLGICRVAPLVYPENRDDVRSHNLLQDALASAAFHHAVVIARGGISSTDSMDLTENLPLSLYPDQDVLVARSPDRASDDCVRRNFPDRTIMIAERRGETVAFRPDLPRK